MFSVVLTQKSEEELDRFINSYRSIFFRLYLDTGLQDESLILESYRVTSKKLKEAILGKIEKYLASDIVLGRKETQIGNAIIFNQRSFLIIIDYTEDKENKIRYIENILFTKK